jgi:hypothetical protein
VECLAKGLEGALLIRVALPCVIPEAGEGGGLAVRNEVVLNQIGTGSAGASFDSMA